MLPGPATLQYSRHRSGPKFDFRALGMQIWGALVPEVADPSNLYCVFVVGTEVCSPHFDLWAPRPLSSFLPKLVGTCPLLRLLSPLAPRLATFAALVQVEDCTATYTVHIHIQPFLLKLVGTCPLLRFLSPLSCRSVVGTCPLLRLLSPLAPWLATIAALCGSKEVGNLFGTVYTTVLQTKSVRCRVRKEMFIQPSLSGIDPL